MPCLSQYLRCNVIRSTTGSIPPLAGIVQFGTEPKVSNFDLHFVVEKNISQFDIAMHNTDFVEIFQTVDELEQVTASLKLSNSYPVPNKLYMARGIPKFYQANLSRSCFDKARG